MYVVILNKAYYYHYYYYIRQDVMDPFDFRRHTGPGGCKHLVRAAIAALRLLLDLLHHTQLQA